MNLETGIHHDARGELIEPAIAPRVFRIGRPPQRWFHHVLLVSAGTVRLAPGDDHATLEGPALAFFPPSENTTMTFSAGAHGTLVGVSPEVFGEAIGDHAESPSLRVFAGRLSLATGLAGDVHRQLLPLFSGFIAELQREARASRMVIAAYARLILMASWRQNAADQPGTEIPSGAGAILQRFRQSVEISFRLHRTISDYADELGISTDRLHAICQRTLSRSPIELVHDRLAQEARLRLERSARSVQEISDSLGFRDPANFSHFFKRKTGVAPAKYRALAQGSPQSSAVTLASSYHDWP